MSKYARKAASGMFSVCKSMQEKLPVAGSDAGGFSELHTAHMEHF